MTENSPNLFSYNFHLPSKITPRTTTDIPPKEVKEGKPKLTLDEFLRERYKTRINQVLKEIEIYPIKPSSDFKSLLDEKSEWHVIDDYMLNQLFFDAKLAGVNISNKSIIKDKINSGFSMSYHPFKEYTKNLPEWDKLPHIDLNFDRSITAKEQELARWMFKKWFVAMVATAMGKTKKTNETVLILKGKQNLGKTTFINNLLPSELDRFFTSQMIQPDNKDHLFRLSTNFIINLDELSTLTAKTVEKYKGMLSLDMVKDRRVFKHFDSNEKVIASFTGTVNDDIFLHDLTGNRRYLVIDVDKINLDYKLNHKGMYAQALALLKDGFRWWFNDEDLKRIEAHTNNYRFKSPLEEIIISEFQPSQETDNPDRWLSSSEILIYLKDKGIPVSNTNAHAVGKIMKALDFKSKKSNGINQYSLDLASKYQKKIKEEYEDLPY